MYHFSKAWCSLRCRYCCCCCLCWSLVQFDLPIFQAKKTSLYSFYTYWMFSLCVSLFFVFNLDFCEICNLNYRSVSTYFLSFLNQLWLKLIDLVPNCIRAIAMNLQFETVRTGFQLSQWKESFDGYTKKYVQFGLVWGINVYTRAHMIYVLQEVHKVAARVLVHPTKFHPPIPFFLMEYYNSFCFFSLHRFYCIVSMVDANGDGGLAVQLLFVFI